MLNIIQFCQLYLNKPPLPFITSVKLGEKPLKMSLPPKEERISTCYPKSPNQSKQTESPKHHVLGSIALSYLKINCEGFPGGTECLKNYGRNFITLYRRQWSKWSLRKRTVKKAKWVSWGSLTNSWEKKTSKRQRRKGKIYPSECRVLKNSTER